MSQTFATLYAAALELPREERIMFAHDLLSSAVLTGFSDSTAAQPAGDPASDYAGLAARDESPEEYQRCTVAAVREGMAAAARGETYEPKEVRAMIPGWVSR